MSCRLQDLKDWGVRILFNKAQNSWYVRDDDHNYVKMVSERVTNHDTGDRGAAFC